MIEDTSQHIYRISRRYALYVLNQGRAIPSLYDGLKMSQRIALWLMHNKSESMKTMNLVGSMIESGLYHHGDQSAGSAISNIAAPFLNNIPYLDPIGAFGTKVDPGGYASVRYTSVKRSKFAQANLYVDLDVAPMVENYDGSNRMPASFLPLLPLVLLNGVTGIAVGYATEILPRSFDQIKKATTEYLKNKKIKTDLIPTYSNYDVEVIRVHGSPDKYQISGRIEKIKENVYRVTEILPGMSLLKLRETLIEMSSEVIDEKTKKVKRDRLIDDFIDNSQKKIDVVVEFLPGVLKPNETDHSILKRLGLVKIVSENIVVLDENGVNDTIRTPEELIGIFVEWRLGRYHTRYENLIRLESLEELFWQSFLACLKGTSRITAIPESLKKFKNKDDLKTAMGELIEAHKREVNPEIVERLASLPLYRWTRVGVEECQEKINESLARSTEYKRILKSPEHQKQIYLDEIKAL